ncbi:MAG: low molecular weight protein-tyrosine-phosphatase [Ruminococcus sp.]|nr:low molecular weight protein-tyrosine-phosphatase [Ruminococcus sp.]
MTRILFICHGNICRSPMAEFVMKYMAQQKGMSDRIYVSSAATSREELGSDMHRGSKNKLRQEGVPFQRRAARQVVPEDYRNFDYLIVMDEINLRNLRRIIPEDTDRKIYKLLDFTDRKGQNIADPWYTGNFDVTYDDIFQGCKALLDVLERREN